MSNRLSTNNATATSAAHIPYALFAAFNFVSGMVRLTSWDQDITFGGNTYQSIGKFAGFSDFEEGTDLTSSSLTFTLSGVDSSIMATALTEKYHNRDASMWVGWLDATNTLVDTPYLLWEGSMDSMPLSSDQSQASINLVCESRLLLLAKTAGWTYSDVHQKQFFTGDGIFNLVASLVNKIINWGAPSTATA
jgi:hypothetical protein